MSDVTSKENQKVGEERSKESQRAGEEVSGRSKENLKAGDLRGGAGAGRGRGGTAAVKMRGESGAEVWRGEGGGATAERRNEGTDETEAEIAAESSPVLNSSHVYD